MHVVPGWYPGGIRPMTHHDIIVIGGSAGALEGVLAIARGLPDDFPAALFVVIHSAPTSPNYLPGLVARAGPLPAATARDGDEIRPGRFYLARPDFHLLLETGRVRVTR